MLSRVSRAVKRSGKIGGRVGSGVKGSDQKVSIVVIWRLKCVNAWER